MGKRANIFAWTTNHRATELPGGLWAPKTQEEMLELIQLQMQELKNMNPDLVCFAEEVLKGCGDWDNPNWKENNQKALELMQASAKELHTNIVISLDEPSIKYPGRWYNTAYIINREGKILDKYRKRHITFRAASRDGLPGDRLVVCETDIGKIGLMTCFDIGWRDDWKKLKDMGAELVVWNTAFDGGSLLNAYAAVHQYFIVAAPWGGNRARARIIDPFGDQLAQSCAWDGLAMASVDLGAEVFHLDMNGSKLIEMREKLGNRITVEVKDLTSCMLISSNDPEWPVERVKREFGLQSYRDYHQEYTEINDALRAEFPEE